jgi:hypothetical protein
MPSSKSPSVRFSGPSVKGDEREHARRLNPHPRGRTPTPARKFRSSFGTDTNLVRLSRDHWSNKRVGIKDVAIGNLRDNAEATVEYIQGKWHVCGVVGCIVVVSLALIPGAIAYVTGISGGTRKRRQNNRKTRKHMAK